MLSLLLIASAAAAIQQHVECDTTVAIGDGKLYIDLWPGTAPIGVARFVELIEGGFFTDLPFFRAIPRFLIQFGINPDTEKQNRWNAKGNIQDDPR